MRDAYDAVVWFAAGFIFASVLWFVFIEYAV